MKKEIWKNIKGYEGLYRVSNYGNVYSVKRSIVMKSKMFGRGYVGVCLSKNSIKRNKYIHRLVIEAFSENRENKPCCNHKDGNKKNNYASNLEWSTYSENQQHAYDMGLNKGPQEEGHGRAKLNRFQVRRIRIMRQLVPNATYKRIADIFNVSIGAIQSIIEKRTWRHI